MRQGYEWAKTKPGEKDKLINDLRKQVGMMAGGTRDYKAINNEIVTAENRYKILSDAKVGLQPRSQSL